MMRTASLLLAAAVLIVAVSGAGLYHRFAAPMGWQQVSPAPANAKVTFHVGLRQTNLDELERRFWAISDPMSDEHQNFMSIDEINELVAPKPQHKSAVYDWLIKSGVNAAQIIDYSDDFEVSTTVAIANKLFSADLFFFKHEDTGKIIINAMGTVSIPDHLMEAISIVTGITTFPHPHLAKALNKSKKVKGFQQVYENDAIIPQTIWNLYGIPSNGLGGNPVSQGVIEFEGQTFTNDDLLEFGRLAGVTVVNVTNIVGPNTHSGGEESSLDIQMVAGVNPTSTNWFWLEDGENWLYEFGQHYFATTNVPQIASISYGWYEGAQCQIDGNECTTLNVTSVGYVQAVDVLFQKIQARGLTLVVSSGDSGAHTRSDEGCSTGYLLADYPGTSPYITSVGATEVVAQTFFPSWQAPVCTPDKTGGWNFTCVSNGYEVAVDVGRSFFTSGGGFSNISATPSYQQTQVTAYLNQRGTQIPPVAMFNTKGRGRPDLSAVGHNAMIVDNGGVGLIGGTSQSSPIIAAIMALLTNEYIKITGKPFGFLNQFLYQMYAAAPNTFNDVIAGDNICPEYGCSPTCRGFIATYGWDPVTGLGTPNYPNMLAYVQKLGANVVARREARAAAAAGKPAVVPRRDQTKFTSA